MLESVSSWELVVGMLGGGDSVGQLAPVMVVHVAQRGHAIALLPFQPFPLQFFPDQVAHGLGAIGVALLADEFVELSGQLRLQGNGETLHRFTSALGFSP